MTENRFRISQIELDEESVVRRTREIEQEREIAIYDLLEGNSFVPDGSHGGPYRLILGTSRRTASSSTSASRTARSTARSCSRSRRSAA